MDLTEKFVISELENKGYPIYYHNFRLKKDNIYVTEYDVISEGFIIEVKSGGEIPLNQRQFTNQIKYLPEGYKLYCYCSNKTDQKIVELNTNIITKGCSAVDFTQNQEIKFINNLESIYNFHPVYNEVNITSQREFTKFLSLSFERLKNFTKVYMLKETYLYTWLCCKYHNDYYSLNDEIKIMHSSKIEYLLEKAILSIQDKLDLNKPFITTKSPRRIIHIQNTNEKIKFKKFFLIPSTKDKLIRIYLHYNLPFIQDITVMCSCQKRYIFCKVSSGKCLECYHHK